MCYVIFCKIIVKVVFIIKSKSNLAIPEGSQIVFDEGNAYIVNQQGVPIYAFTNVTLTSADSKQDHPDESLPSPSPEVTVTFEQHPLPQSKKVNNTIKSIMEAWSYIIAHANF